MTSSTFRFQIHVPRWVTVGRSRLSRDDFYAWIWQEFQNSGLVGVHEGTVLSEDAASQGHETESWTIDAGEAPRERDWIADLEIAENTLYFSTRKEAESAQAEILKLSEFKSTVGEIQEQKPEDWDAKWKASFQGASVPPFWKVLPPWVDPDRKTTTQGPMDEMILRINPGAGFGTGTHETTQLCLQTLGAFHLSGLRVLDFGSGSGILSIAARLLGARVDGVEIDPLAIENATQNAKLNSVETDLSFERKLTDRHQNYSLIIANILKPVLLEFAPELVSRLAPEGSILLSGLMKNDVDAVVSIYQGLLDYRFGSFSYSSQVSELGEWRSILFTPEK